MGFLSDQWTVFERVFRRVTRSSYQYHHGDFDPGSASALQKKIRVPYSRSCYTLESPRRNPDTVILRAEFISTASNDY